MSVEKLSYNNRLIRRANSEEGFTLLELLVVIVILGLLIGLVAPAVLRQLGHSKNSVARESIERIGSVLDLYKLDAGTYPSTEDGLQALIAKPDDDPDWAGPYLKSNNRREIRGGIPTCTSSLLVGQDSIMICVLWVVPVNKASQAI